MAEFPTSAAVLFLPPVFPGTWRNARLSHKASETSGWEGKAQIGTVRSRRSEVSSDVLALPMVGLPEDSLGMKDSIVPYTQEPLAHEV